MRGRTPSRRRFLQTAAIGTVGSLAGCSSVPRLGGPTVRSADVVDSDLPTGDAIVASVPNVGPGEFLDRELWIRGSRPTPSADHVSVSAEDVRYALALEPTDYERTRRRKEFLGASPVETTAGYDVYRPSGFEAISPEGRVRSEAERVRLTDRELFDRCLAAATGEESLLSDEDVRTLTERVRARDALDLYLLDDEVYGDERMRVPGTRATAVGDSHLDENATLREVAGLYPAGDVDPEGFEQWVVANVAPAVQSIPTVVRDGRVMRASWENEGRRPTPTPTPDAPRVTVWVVATGDGWRFWYPDEGLERRKELVVPADARVEMEVTSHVDAVSLEIPALNVRTDALPGTFTSVPLDPSGPAEHEITCSGPCQWEYDRPFSSPFRIVSRSRYREWVAAADA